jgi:4a-hydroxytetrahydrobiopterin dehydratase
MELTKKNCVPCEGGMAALDAERVGSLVSQVKGWRAEEGGRRIAKRFKFGSFLSTMAFVDRMAVLAEAEGHHPDFCVHYDVLEVTLSTHAISGLSENDFILAAKLDELHGDTGGSKTKD